MAGKAINFILMFIGIAGSLAFMKLTHDGFQQKLITKHFSVPNLSKNQDAKMTLLLTLGLYFAAFTIVLKVLGWLLGLFDRCKNYAATVERILLNSYDYFIIVFLILFYLLRNKQGFDVKQKPPLFGYWFISGRILYTFGYFLTTLTGLNLKVPGVAITYNLIVLMIAEAVGFNGFKYLQMIPSLNQL